MHVMVRPSILRVTRSQSLSNAIVAGIDDFDDAGVSLFSAFNMLVLGVFQIDTVRVLLALVASLAPLTLFDAAVHQMRAESDSFPVVIPVLYGLHSNNSPESPHWYLIVASAFAIVLMLVPQPS
jgi:hypothetical protein